MPFLADSRQTVMNATIVKVFQQEAFIEGNRNLLERSIAQTLSNKEIDAEFITFSVKGAAFGANTSIS